MKVTQVTTRILQTPADNHLVVGLPPTTDTREFVTLELATDEGIEGIGLTFFGGPLTKALREAVEGLGALVIGEDPHRVEAIADKLRLAASGSGPGGIFTLALSAIDIAFDIPQGNIHGRHRKCGNAPTSDIMDMPLHKIINFFDVRTVFADQCRHQIVLDHCVDCPSTLAAGVGVPRTLATVSQRYGSGNEFKVGVIAVFGIGKYFRQRNGKYPDVYIFYAGASHR